MGTNGVTMGTFFFNNKNWSSYRFTFKLTQILQWHSWSTPLALEYFNYYIPCLFIFKKGKGKNDNTNNTFLWYDRCESHIEYDDLINIFIFCISDPIPCTGAWSHGIVTNTLVTCLLDLENMFVLQFSNQKQVAKYSRTGARALMKTSASLDFDFSLTWNSYVQVLQHSVLLMKIMVYFMVHL